MKEKQEVLDFSYWLMDNCTLSEDRSVYSHDTDGEDYTNERLYEIFKIHQKLDKHLG